MKKAIALFGFLLPVICVVLFTVIGTADANIAATDFNTTATSTSSIKNYTQDISVTETDTTTVDIQDNPIIQMNETTLSRETEEFLYGTWRVEKFLGFQYITRDDIEWPNGERVIGKTILIYNDLFSSLDFKDDYRRYCAEIENPVYKISDILTGSDIAKYLSLNADESIRNLENEMVLMINPISSNFSDISGPSLYVIDNNRLLLSLNCDYFELIKINQDLLAPTDSLGNRANYKEALAEMTTNFYAIQIIEAEQGTILIGTETVSSHSYTEMYMVFKSNSALGEGEILSLPLPLESFYSPKVPDSIWLSEDGLTLYYTCRFSDLATIDMNGLSVLHEDGTYSYTTDLITGETTLIITPN